MELIGYDDNLAMLRLLFPDKYVISSKECARVLDLDVRTVFNLKNRVKNPLPLVRLTYTQRSRYGISLPDLARWICVERGKVECLQ